MPMGEVVQAPVTPPLAPPGADVDTPMKFIHETSEIIEYGPGKKHRFISRQLPPVLAEANRTPSSASTDTFNTAEVVTVPPTPNMEMDSHSHVSIHSNDDETKEISDKQGLDEAHAAPAGIFVHRNTMYVTGTRWSGQDWLDDLRLTDQWTHLNNNAVHKTWRYKEAMSALRHFPRVTRLVGHSLGAAVVEKLGEETDLAYQSYNSPTPSWNPDPNRKHKSDVSAWDPLTFLNRGAKRHKTDVFNNPHSYHTLDLNAP